LLYDIFAACWWGCCCWCGVTAEMLRRRWFSCSR
jgi:hypothetical protein